MFKKTLIFSILITLIGLWFIISDDALLKSNAGEKKGSIESKAIPTNLYPQQRSKETEYPIGTNTLLKKNFVISQADDHQTYPAVARKTAHDKYLIVWDDERFYQSLGYYCVYGQIVNSQGGMVGEDFPISVALSPWGKGRPAVAYNSNNSENLVVFQLFNDIYGQLVSITGSLIGTPFAISIASDDQILPSVAHDPADNNYLVIWEDKRDSTLSNLSDIYGQLVSSSGALIGNNFPISIADDSQHHPTLAYNSTANNYLVVWDDYRNWANGADVYGQLVTHDGYLTPVPDPTVNFSISTRSLTQNHPSVSYNPSHNNYLVVWMDIIYEGIGAQIVSADGTLSGTNFPIISALNHQEEPSVAYNSKVDTYLVVWHDSRMGNYDIYGRWVKADGSLSGESFPISSAAEDQQHAVVVYSSRYSNLLVAWQDERNYSTSGWDIYGQVLSFGPRVVAAHGLNETNNGSSRVKLFDTYGNLSEHFKAFGAVNALGEVNVATGDLDGDGDDEIVCGQGKGGKSWIKLFEANGVLIRSFKTFGIANVQGEVNLAVGNFDIDTSDVEIAVGQGPGGKSFIKIFESDGTFLRSFKAFGTQNPSGEVHLADGDLDGDGYHEIIVGHGEGGSSWVKVFTYDGGFIRTFKAFSDDWNPNGEVHLTTGNFDSDADVEIAVATGDMADSKVRIFDKDGTFKLEFEAFYSYENPSGAVYICAGDVDDDGIDELFAGTGGEGGKSLVRIFDHLGKRLRNFTAFAFSYGVHLAKVNF